MTEKDALALMRQNDAAGLSWFIHQYTPYVSAIVWNIVHPPLTAQDGEEIVADVFLTLWQYCEYPRDGKVKAYLGSIARSRAIDRLRGHKVELTLEYDALELPAAGPEDFILSQETQLRLRQALEAMEPVYREIFIRHYYYCQTAAAIAKDMKLRPDLVRQRLKRGRDLLRRQLMKGEHSHDR